MWLSSYGIVFRAERTAASKGQGGRINKLISPSDDSVGGATPPTLAHAVQEQCQLADGFILAVDATNLDEESKFRLQIILLYCRFVCPKCTVCLHSLFFCVFL